MKLSTVS